MICMIDHIVVEQAVKDGIHEGAPYTHVRAQIKKLYAKEGTDTTGSTGRTVRGSDGKVLPPEKSVPPEYIPLTRDGGGIPGLLPPAG